MNNIIYSPVYIWRIFVGSINPLIALFASYIYQIYLSWILLAFTEMSVIKTFMLLKELSSTNFHHLKYSKRHGLRTPREEIVFTSRPKTQSQSQIFSPENGS